MLPFSFATDLILVRNRKIYTLKYLSTIVLVAYDQKEWYHVLYGLDSIYVFHMLKLLTIQTAEHHEVIPCTQCLSSNAMQKVRSPEWGWCWGFWGTDVRWPGGSSPQGLVTHSCPAETRTDYTPATALVLLSYFQSSILPNQPFKSKLAPQLALN